MINIKLFDGTSDSRAGRAVAEAISELEKIVGTGKVICNPNPPCVDRDSYTCVTDSINEVYNDSRKQVNSDEFVLDFVEHYTDLVDHESINLVLIEQDLYSNSTNFVLGSSRGFKIVEDGKKRKMIVQSTSRLLRDHNHTRNLFDDSTFLKQLILHELGHAFGAATEDRIDTYESLGSHCIEPECVMHQYTNIEEGQEVAHKRENNDNLFCGLCIDDIKSYNSSN